MHTCCFYSQFKKRQTIEPMLQWVVSFYLILNWKQGNPARIHGDIIKASSQNCLVQSLVLNSEKSLFLKWEPVRCD